MKRTTKNERKLHAQAFWNCFQNGAIKQAIVVERNKSTTNPYIVRTQFKAVCSMLKDDPVVIAESTTHGIEGCFVELLTNIKNVPQTRYYDDGFKDFLSREYNLQVNYNDGLVIMLERKEVYNED